MYILISKWHRITIVFVMQYESHGNKGKDKYVVSFHHTRKTNTKKSNIIIKSHFDMGYSAKSWTQKGASQPFTPINVRNANSAAEIIENILVVLAIKHNGAMQYVRSRLLNECTLSVQFSSRFQFQSSFKQDHKQSD